MGVGCGCFARERRSSCELESNLFRWERLFLAVLSYERVFRWRKVVYGWVHHVGAENLRSGRLDVVRVRQLARFPAWSPRED